MSDNLTTLIGKVQNILGDASGTYFTTAVCTAAIRQALSEWNLRAPQFLGTEINGVGTQYVYEVSDIDTEACEVIDVLQVNTDAEEQETSVAYDYYVEDERLFFRLREPVNTGEYLLIRYAKYHTISGLDSATESTLPARHDQAIVDGGAFFSIMIRATSRIETINLSQDQSDNYREIAGGFAAAFQQRLGYAVRSRKPAVSEPDTRTWDDAYHTWEQ
jgi:hypothetical protein